MLIRSCRLRKSPEDPDGMGVLPRVPNTKGTLRRSSRSSRTPRRRQFPGPSSTALPRLGICRNGLACICMDLLYFAYFAVNAVTCWYMLWHTVTCCDWKWLEIIGMIGLGMIGLTEWITIYIIYITMNTKYIKIYNIIQWYTMNIMNTMITTESTEKSIIHSESGYVRICQNMSEYDRICQNMSVNIALTQKITKTRHHSTFEVFGKFGNI